MSQEHICAPGRPISSRCTPCRDDHAQRLRDHASSCAHVCVLAFTRCCRRACPQPAGRLPAPTLARSRTPEKVQHTVRRVKKQAFLHATPSAGERPPGGLLHFALGPRRERVVTGGLRTTLPQLRAVTGARAFAADWKDLTVLPSDLPSSGSLLGPKTRATTPPMTTNSGRPRPKRPATGDTDCRCRRRVACSDKCERELPRKEAAGLARRDGAPNDDAEW